MDREQERALRDAAQAAHASGEDHIVPGSEHEIVPREIKQMLSVRLDPRLLAALRRLARRQGRQTSEVVRDALDRYITAESAQQVTVYEFDLVGAGTEGFNIGFGVTLWNGTSLEETSRERTGNPGHVITSARASSGSGRP